MKVMKCEDHYYSLPRHTMPSIGIRSIMADDYYDRGMYWSSLRCVHSIISECLDLKRRFMGEPCKLNGIISSMKVLYKKNLAAMKRGRLNIELQ